MSFERTKISKDALTVVKTTQLFMTEFVGSTSDPTMTRGLLKSAPNIHKTGVTFFLDYSQTSNSSDLKLLKRFFSNLGTGNTFSVSSCLYYDEETQSKYNFEGIYQLAGNTGIYNNFLYFTGISYSASLVDGTYKNYNFKNVLNFSTAKNVTAQYFMSRLNTENPYNLSFFGIYGNNLGSEEYLEVLNTKANNNRYLITDYIPLNDNSEIAILHPSTSATSEKMYFEQKTINLLMRGVPDLNTLSQSKYQNGIIKKIDSNQKTLDILTHQNLHQRFSRAESDKANYYDWYAVSETDNFKNVLNPYVYDKLSMSVQYYSYVKIGVITETSFSNISTSAQPTVNTITVLTVDNIATTNKIYQSSSGTSIPNVKLDLSDSSLVGWKILPYYDEACSIPLNNYYYLNGVPGFDGASFIFVSNPDAPSSFYVKFEKDIVLKLRITV